jgi:transcriptional/translational regulatory protein YebC/TACO1
MAAPSFQTSTQPCPVGGASPSPYPRHVIRCAFSDLSRLQKATEDRRITPLSAESEYIPQTPIELPEDRATEVLKMVDLLEQDEDVQRVFHNLA